MRVWVGAANTEIFKGTWRGGGHLCPHGQEDGLEALGLAFESGQVLFGVQVLS